MKQNAALQDFSRIIGVWDTQGNHGLIAGVVLHGRTSFDWFEAGFIRMESSITEDVGIPAGVALIGSDDNHGTYNMLYYDERGVSRLYNVSLQANVLRWWRDAPDFAQRYSLTISDDGQTMVGKGELQRDGMTWQKDLNLTYTKVNTPA